MLLFVFAGALTLIVGGVLIRPLLRELPAPLLAERYNAAVYRDQLQELQAEETRLGAVNASMSDPLAAQARTSARLEIERRLLATLKRTPAVAPQTRPAPVMAAMALAAGLTLAAGVIYLAVGDPAARDQPLKRAPPPVAAASGAPGRMAAGPDGMHAGMDQMIASLSRKLAAHPDDPDGWGLLARSLMRLDRPADAVGAYRKAISLTHGANAQLDAEYAEARVIAAGGTVDAEAFGLFQRLLAADPANPQARYYLALAKAQTGDVAGGLADWRALQAASPADAPWMETLRTRIADAEAQVQAQAAPGPAAVPGAAGVDAVALPGDGEREKLIDGMVGRLAARLKRTPDDVNGWRELARADAVLGRQDQLAEAQRQIQRLEHQSP